MSRSGDAMRAQIAREIARAARRRPSPAPVPAPPPAPAGRCDRWIVTDGNLPKHLCTRKVGHVGECK